jgi:hypothetical protein
LNAKNADPEDVNDICEAPIQNVEKAPVEAEAENNDDKRVENDEAPAHDAAECASFVERVFEGVSRVVAMVTETVRVVISEARRVLGSIISWFATGA